jgi:hypothetical protein
MVAMGTAMQFLGIIQIIHHNGRVVNLDVNLGDYFTLCFVTVDVDNLDRAGLCYFSYYQM